MFFPYLKFYKITIHHLPFVNYSNLRGGEICTFMVGCIIIFRSPFYTGTYLNLGIVQLTDLQSVSDIGDVCLIVDTKSIISGLIIYYWFDHIEGKFDKHPEANYLSSMDLFLFRFRFLLCFLFGKKTLRIGIPYVST